MKKELLSVILLFDLCYIICISNCYLSVTKDNQKIGYIKRGDDGSLVFYKGIMTMTEKDVDITFCASCYDCVCGQKDPFSLSCDPCWGCWKDIGYECKKKCDPCVCDCRDCPNDGSKGHECDCGCGCPSEVVVTQTPTINVNCGNDSTIMQMYNNCSDLYSVCNQSNSMYAEQITHCEKLVTNQTCQNDCMQQALACNQQCSSECTGDTSEVTVCVTLCLQACTDEMKTCMANNCGVSQSSSSLYAQMEDT